LACSGEDGNRIAADQVEVDVDAESGPVRRPHHAFGVDDNVVDQSVFLDIVGQDDLEEFRVRYPAHDVQIGDIVQGIAAMVDLEIHAESLGEVRGLHTCRDAAFDGDVAAQIVGRLVQYPWCIGVKTAGRKLR